MTLRRQVPFLVPLTGRDRDNQRAAEAPDSMTRQSGVAGAGPGSGEAGAAPPHGTEVTLRLMATSDIHAMIFSYDYFSNRPVFGQGLAQTASLIAAARAEHPDAVLLDNGDFLQGSVLADMAAMTRRQRPHPVIAAMNALGYDAACLGNHEFNFGLPVLQRALAEARFPVVSANVLTAAGRTPREDSLLVPSFALIDRALPDDSGRRHRVRLGVLGLTPPEILLWDRQHLEGRLKTRPMLEAARAWLPELRHAGADVVVCLAHTGIPLAAGGLESDGLAAEVAGLDGVDALVAGHSHQVFPDRGTTPDPRVDAPSGRIAGKPAVQPGHNGSHLGVIDLRLRWCGAEWRVLQTRARVISVSEVVAGLSPAEIRRNAAPLDGAIRKDHDAALAWTRRSLGRSELPMSSCFAQVADVPAMRLVGLAKVDHLRRALAGTPLAGLPVVATTTAYRTGGRGGVLNYSEVPAGPLTVRHVFDLLPYPNTLISHLTTGAELAELLERSAALFLQLRPGVADQPLIDPAFPGFAFAAVYGLGYRIDVGLPARYDVRGRMLRPGVRRVRGLVHPDGRPLAPEERLVLVTSSYRSNGTFGMDKPAPEAIVLDDRMLCTDVLRGFLARAGTVTPDLLENAGPHAGWTLAPVPGATALYDTGAPAARHLAEAGPLRPEFLGLTEEGFHRYRLHF